MNRATVSRLKRTIALPAILAAWLGALAAPAGAQLPGPQLVIGLDGVTVASDGRTATVTAHDSDPLLDLVQLDAAIDFYDGALSLGRQPLTVSGDGRYSVDISALPANTLITACLVALDPVLHVEVGASCATFMTPPAGDGDGPTDPGPGGGTSTGSGGGTGSTTGGGTGTTTGAGGAATDGGANTGTGTATGGQPWAGESLVAAALTCTTRDLVLVDVLAQNGRVKLLGAADARFIGRRLVIRFLATGRIVARPKVRPDGTFEATAALPSPALRRSNRARYQALLGDERSLSLKLARRMVLHAVAVSGGRVSITGRVTRPLPRRPETIVLSERRSCSRYVAVKGFKAARNGRFRVTVPAPQGATAVYRLSTHVPAAGPSRKRFRTYTLPRPVFLGS